MIKTFQTRNDFIKTLSEGLVMCEIGVFKGEFSEILLNTNPKELHLIDPFEGPMYSGDKDGQNIVWTNLSEDFERLTNKYKEDSRVVLHKGYSQNVLETFVDSYFDLIYIDGDHTYQAVKSDLNTAKRKVTEGGLICGHDFTNISFPQVVQAVYEFCQENDLQVSILSSDGCPTFGIVNNKH